MKFSCTVRRIESGEWTARHSGSDLGAVDVIAPDREQALDKLRRELQYRLEICPCTGERYEDVAIELVERNDG